MHFYADLDARLATTTFVAGTKFTAADITAIVSVDFAQTAVESIYHGTTRIFSAGASEFPNGRATGLSRPWLSNGSLGQDILRFGTCLAIVLASVSVAHAHGSDAERGLVMLLPTTYYLAGGAFAVVTTFAVLAMVPAEDLEQAVALRWALFRVRHAPWDIRFPDQRFRCRVLGLLVLAGLVGSRDPLANPLPTMFWTIWWVAFHVATCDLRQPVEVVQSLARTASADQTDHWPTSCGQTGLFNARNARILALHCHILRVRVVRTHFPRAERSDPVGEDNHPLLVSRSCCDDSFRGGRVGRHRGALLGAF